MEFFYGNTLNNRMNESCKPIELRNRVVPIVTTPTSDKKKVTEVENKNRLREKSKMNRKS